MMATMQQQPAHRLAPSAMMGGGPEVEPEDGGAVGTVVVVRKSGRDGGRFPLAKGTATIGRLESCDIRIALPYVSRKHAELRVEDGKVRCGAGVYVWACVWAWLGWGVWW